MPVGSPKSLRVLFSVTVSGATSAEATAAKEQVETELAGVINNGACR